MIGENKEEDIAKYSEEAFSFIEDDPKKSIEKLCKLRAVGPATASGKFHYSFYFLSLPLKVCLTIALFSVFVKTI